MILFSYVVSRDYGFAPNPFGGYCTLAACKPKIRSAATPGDWVIGTGGVATGVPKHLIFAIRITEKITFDEYWVNLRFQYKKPYFRASKKHAYGDNIYHSVGGKYHQENSHHSNADGSVNNENLVRDTKSPYVLISEDYIYFGGDGPLIPQDMRELVKDGPSHKSVSFSEDFKRDVVSWLRGLNVSGFQGRPASWG